MLGLGTAMGLGRVVPFGFTAKPGAIPQIHSVNHDYTLQSVVDSFGNIFHHIYTAVSASAFCKQTATAPVTLSINK